MPRGVIVDQWIVVTICIQVQTQGVAALAAVAVLLHKPGNFSVVEPGVQVVQVAAGVVIIPGVFEGVRTAPRLLQYHPECIIVVAGDGVPAAVGQPRHVPVPVVEVVQFHPAGLPGDEPEAVYIIYLRPGGGKFHDDTVVLVAVSTPSHLPRFWRSGSPPG